LKKTPGLCRGQFYLIRQHSLIFPNRHSASGDRGLLISAGAEENEEKRFEKYQADALQYGVLVDYTIAPARDTI